MLHIMGGMDFTNLSNNGSVAINEIVVNNYNTQRRTTIEPIFGIGMEHIFTENYYSPVRWGVGISGYYAKLGEIKGTEYPFANDGNYSPLQYHFNISTDAIMIEPRLIYSDTDWQPYILAGIGWAWNNLYDYNEYASCTEGAAPVPEMFANRTANTLAYEFGVGIQHQIYYDDVNDIHYFFSGDYRYFNFGKGQLGHFPAETTGNDLQIQNLITQALLFSIQMSFG
jgi:hypothetical protein